MVNTIVRYKNVLWVVSILVALALIAGPALIKAATSYVSSQASATATSTMSFMSPGAATTTYQLDGLASNKVQEMGEIDSAAVYIAFNASSSSSILAYQVQYSNNNVDWYGESASLSTANANIASTSNAVTQEASTTVTHLWSPGASGTSTKAILLPPLPAKHERLIFSIPVGSANGAIYFETALKRLPATP